MNRSTTTILLALFALLMLASPPEALAGKKRGRTGKRRKSKRVYVVRAKPRSVGSTYEVGDKVKILLSNMQPTALTYFLDRVKGGRWMVTVPLNWKRKRVPQRTRKVRVIIRMNFPNLPDASLAGRIIRDSVRANTGVVRGILRGLKRRRHKKKYDETWTVEPTGFVVNSPSGH